MKIIDIRQGTPEWHEFRRHHIGASDCAAVVGKDPFKTAFKVYNDKLGAAGKPSSAAMLRGVELEPEARAYFNQKYDIDWQPCVGEHEDYPWMGVSLDGWDGTTVLEIKCPGEKRFREVQRTGKAFPEHVWQTEHALEVTGANAAIIGYYYSSQDRIESVEICIGRDKTMIDELIAKERAFWHDNVLIYVPPAVDPAKDYLERLDQDWMDAEGEYMLAYKLQSDAEDRLKAAKSKLVDLAGEDSCRGDSLIVSRFAKEGTIRYKDMPIIQSLTDEYRSQYRGPARIEYRVSLRS